MPLYTAQLMTKHEIAPDSYLLEVHAPQLAQTVQPGQYCMVRCADLYASDPFLRRAFFVHEIERERGICRFLLSVYGRGTGWLSRQQVGTELDILGPLGRGWTLSSRTRNLLLLGERPLLAAVTCLAQHALAQELTVTLIDYVGETHRPGYPAALLSPEIEYQVFSGTPEQLAHQLSAYLGWADNVYCSVSRETLALLMRTDVRWQEPSFAQVALGEALPCALGTCMNCQVETQRGLRLVCRDGPVFALSELYY